MKKEYPEPIEISNDDLLKMKKIELNILLDFDRVCRELGLVYFLCAGTLLGAVRHGGFIPWDDDIDVQMPRKDYEKFIEEAPKHLNSDHFVSSYKTEDEFLGDFFKVVNKKTTFVELSTYYNNITKGVYIDVFPIDGIPDNKAKRFYYSLRIAVLKQRINKGYFHHKVYKSKSFKGRIFSAFSALITLFMNPFKATKKLNAYILKHNTDDSKYVTVESKTARLYKREIFGATTEVEFEGHSFHAPSLINDYLTKQYGNHYMELPPEEKRISHHYCARIDLTGF